MLFHEVYKDKGTPTLVARKEGDAWTQPFAVVYEPYSGSRSRGSVREVKTLEQDGVFKGFWVESSIDGKRSQQLVLMQEEDQVFESPEWDLRFEGHFAIVNMNGKDEVESVYIGSGKRLRIGELVVEVEDSEGAVFHAVD